jgi:hypothetical protein
MGGNSSGCGISYQYLHTYFRQPQEILLASSIGGTCFRRVYCNAWERPTRKKCVASTGEANKICCSWPPSVCKYWYLTTQFENKGHYNLNVPPTPEETWKFLSLFCPVISSLHYIRVVTFTSRSMDVLGFLF